MPQKTDDTEATAAGAMNDRYWSHKQQEIDDTGGATGHKKEE